MKTLIISLASLGTAMGMSTNFLAATKIAQPLRQSESLLTSPHATSKMKVYWDQKNTDHHKDLIFDATFTWDGEKSGHKFFYHEVQRPEQNLPWLARWKPLNDNQSAETRVVNINAVDSGYQSYFGTPFDENALDSSNFTKYQMKDFLTHSTGGMWMIDAKKILDFSNIEMQLVSYPIFLNGKLFAVFQQVIGISIFHRHLPGSNEWTPMAAIFGFIRWEIAGGNVWDWWIESTHLNLGTGIEIEYRNA